MQIRSIRIQILTIRIQILTIRKGFEAFESDSKYLKKGFKAFEWKFETFERDSKHSNPNSNYSKGTRSIRMQIQTIRKSKFELLERHSKRTSCHSKGIRRIGMQIQNFRKGFEVLEWKFKPFEQDSKHWNAYFNIEKGF